MTFHVCSDIKEEFPTLDYLWHANLRQKRTCEAEASKGRTSAGRETFKSLIRTTCSFLLSLENYSPVKPEKWWRLLRRRIIPISIVQLSSAKSRSLWPRPPSHGTPSWTLIALLSESGTITKQENTPSENSLCLDTAPCCSPTSTGNPMKSCDYIYFFSFNVCNESHRNAILPHIQNDHLSVCQILYCRNLGNAVQTRFFLSIWRVCVSSLSHSLSRPLSLCSV